jgi:hypothetical protein
MNSGVRSLLLILSLVMNVDIKCINLTIQLKELIQVVFATLMTQVQVYVRVCTNTIIASSGCGWQNDGFLD